MAATISRPRVGISGCLLGRPLRYDGGHKRSRFVCDALAPHVELVAVCPEVEIGLPTPREAMRLVGDPGRPRLVGSRSGRDHTAEMTRFARERVEALARADLDGFLLMKGSPSCGLERVRVLADAGADGSTAARVGTGLFAAALRRELPELPLAEAGWLNDDSLRESFLSQLFTRHRIRVALREDASPGALAELHAAHKFLYLAHSPAQARSLGRIVAGAAGAAPAAVAGTYTRQAMAALAVPATRGKHANVLQHIVGFFRSALSGAERDELLDLIAEYRAGVYPLAVPVTLLVHHLRRREVSRWLAMQVYFSPYPRAIEARP